MNRWGALAVFLAFAGALAFRLPKLDTRPLHNDEAVNAVKVTELWQTGRYIYDPDEYHGPTLHYATLPFLTLSGAANPEYLSDATLRLAPVFFGAGLILLLFLLKDGLGFHSLIWSAIFIALSPAMVFYSRYFIHEMLLVFFTALALGSGYRYFLSRSPLWAVVTGTAVGLMFATKETFVITLAAMFAAGVGTLWWAVPTPKPFRSFFASIKWSDIILAFLAMAVVWVLFFSSFFANFAGLIDSVKTYFPWLKRAAGSSPHLHPWYFYLQRLAWFHPVKGPAWSEGFILLFAFIGAVFCLTKKRSPLLCFLTIYTITLTVAYSVISYKTPWCLLSFYYGMILLAGIGIATILESIRSGGRVAILVLVLAMTGQLAWQSWRASFLYSADRRNPYVYAQTVPDILKLVKRVKEIAAVSPARFETIVKVAAPESDYWPLPWYLRRLKHVGWYEKIPEDPFSPIIIVSSKLNAQLDEKSERKWIMTGLSELRPGKFFELYVELELWKKYLESAPVQEE